MLVTSNLFAQHDITTYNLNFAGQTNLTNPGIQPKTAFYIGATGYGGVANTGFSYSDVVKKVSNDTAYIDVTNFLSKLNTKNHTIANANANFSLGFRIKKTYIHLGATEKANVNFTYSKDFFNFALKGNGHPDLIGKQLEIGNFITNATHYREYYLGLSHRFTCNFTAGITLKKLYGMENIHTVKRDLSLTTDPVTFDLIAKSDIYLQSSGLDTNARKQIDNDFSGYLSKRNNKGWGIDIGAEYKKNKFTLSGSILDLGFIKWNSYLLDVKSKNAATYTFTGIDIRQLYKDSTDYAKSITDSLEKTFNIEQKSGNKYTTYLNAKIYLSASYNVSKRTRVGGTFFGQFYNQGFHPAISVYASQEFWKILQLQVNYSYLNRSFANIGAGLVLNLGPIQVYAASDNVLGALIVPKKAKTVQARVGANIVWAYTRDKKDPCYIGQNLAPIVIDTDKDGIPDLEDRCPNTAGIKAFYGCPDTDKDSIPDHDDLCPTVAGIKLFGGCPDTDKDGIEDSKDACPTVAGLKIYAGCPDTDKDGLQDSEDDCPTAAGPAENKGCPYKDTDGDGILDKDDYCITEKGTIERKGCPPNKFDTDHDGLMDDEDNCPNEPGRIENKGCPKKGDVDTDGDGVWDAEDKCPKTPGTKANNGCPEIKKEEQEVLNVAFEDLEFETGKAIIKSESYPSLDKLADLLVKKVDYKLNIAGHTDNQGKPAANLTLSKNRANAVKEYLVKKGVAATRLKAEFFGDKKPIAPNKTPEGRQKNRRVEMRLKFD